MKTALLASAFAVGTLAAPTPGTEQVANLDKRIKLPFIPDYTPLATSGDWTYKECRSDLFSHYLSKKLSSAKSVSACLSACAAQTDAVRTFCGLTDGGECYTTPTSGATGFNAKLNLLDSACRGKKCPNSDNACGTSMGMVVYQRPVPVVEEPEPEPEPEEPETPALPFGKIANDDWSYVACYTDSVAARTILYPLGSTTWTASNCLKLASAAGYKYAGIIYGGECWGANEIASTGSIQNADQCAWGCNDARNTETCGGASGLDVYVSKTWVAPEPTTTVPDKPTETAPPAEFPVDPSPTSTEEPSAKPTQTATKVKVGKWEYAGCFTNTEGLRPLTNLISDRPDWTATSCLNAAQDAGYQVAGLIYAGECWAGEAGLSAGTDKVSADQCNWDCNDARGVEQCGGASAYDVYTLGSTKMVADKEFSYVGCYTNDNSARTLANLIGEGERPWTVPSCLDLAQSSGYLYAGIIAGGECWAANEISSSGSQQDDSMCLQACNDGEYTCGSANGLDIYKNRVWVAPEPTSTISSAPTETETATTTDEPSEGPTRATVRPPAETDVTPPPTEEFRRRSLTAGGQHMRRARRN
ncbi:hypothetical protein JCM8547_009039 [Rhodosporidiobolus lusitaniae]